MARVAEVDASTHSLVGITYAHHEVHSGTHYFYDSHHDIAKAGVLEHLIITSDTSKQAHFEHGVESTAGQVVVELFEAPTVTDNGALETSRNRNRNFADNNTTLVYEAPTVTVDGDLIDSSVYGTGKNSSTGGGDRGDREIVLKQNTIYLLRVTERDVLATTINLIFDWYEHAYKG
jgi:hypothetical protein